MFRANNFDKLLDKATSNLRLDPDWPTILQICDLIRQNDCTPKYAMAGVKKKLYSQNPHQAMFALLTLESIVKNCGSAIHDEVTSKPFCEMLHDLVKTTQHENLRNKILELIQAWAFAFRNTPKYRSVQDTVNILKAEGYKFPALKESDAMFSADTAPEWADGEVCHRCRVAFSLMVRRHHCRACGQVFCQQCSSKTSTLPKFGIEKEVRVCDACFDKVSRPPSSSAKLEIVDTSSDYGTTAQPQKRPGKSAEELQEEEELQLALALSQSEAEQKEKDKRSRAHVNPNPVSLHPTVSPTPSSVSASPEHGPAGGAELSRYLDRGYWEQRLAAQPEPTAPASHSSAETSVQEYTKPSPSKQQEEDDAEDKEIDEFVGSLKSQVEIFVNRMKSNSSRGRSIANDSSVQTLFMNITAMHSKLLRYIQQQDDKRVYLESLQDKVSQIRDSRAALDTLRAEHAARLAAAAEAADRQRQMQMAAKLQAMRKKKHEYLQYQRQLALQRVQEQEREMQMRQEQQKHQYMMAAGGYYVPGVSMHQYQPAYANPQYQMIPTDGPTQTQMTQPATQLGGPTQSMPQMTNQYVLPTASTAVSQAALNQPRMQPQMGMQPQVLMQQMHQMRLSSQHGVHQMMPQPNGFAQQNGQPMKQGQNVPNMMPQMNAGQPNASQPGNPANPMMAMQMQNMRMPMMTSAAPNPQVPGAGFMTNQTAHGMQAPGQQMPGHQMTGQQMPNQQIQGQQMPGQQMPGQQMPGQQMPGQQMPSQQIPGQPMPGQQMPGQQMPGQQMPGQQIPGQQMPGQQMPGQQIQSQPMPGQQIPNQQLPGQQPPNQSMPNQHMPNQQIPGQQIPSQQNPNQQIPGQQLPGQHIPNPQIPGQQAIGQQIMPNNGPNMSVPSHVKQNNQNVPQSQAQHMPQIQGQPMSLPSQPMVAGAQNHMNMQMMPGHSQPNQGPPNQQMNNHQQFVQQIPGQGQPVPSHGQQMPHQQPMIQNQTQMPQGQPLQQMPGQQMKMPPQNYMPPGQPPLPNQQQQPIKSESNNNTAELIRFD